MIHCEGCAMEGKYDVIATHRFEKEDRIVDPCLDAYEYSLKGASCLVLHHHFEKRTRYLCDKHYEMHQKYNQSSQITYR